MNATDLMPTAVLAVAVLIIVALGGIRYWITGRIRARRARRTELAPRHRRRRGADEELRKEIRRWVRS